MGRVLVLPEGARESAHKAIKRRETLGKEWRSSAERESAMKQYVGKYVAVRDKKIIEHSKDMNALFKAIELRKSKGEDILEILTDHLVQRKEGIEGIREILRESDEMHSRDPAAHELSELYRRAYSSVTQKELDRPFTI